MFRVVAAPLFSLAVAAFALGLAGPASASVLFDGTIFKSGETGKQFSKIYKSSKKVLGLKSRAVTYDWSTPGDGLAPGSVADFDGHLVKSSFNKNALQKAFGKKFASKYKVGLFLFTGSGNELVVETPDELFAALSSPTGDTENGFEIGGVIKFAIRLIDRKTGKIKQQINDTFLINSALSGVGETEDGIAMFLQGATAGKKSGLCTKGKKSECTTLRSMFYTKKGFKLNLALTGANDGTGGFPGGGDPIFDTDDNPPPPEVLIVENDLNEPNDPNNPNGTNGTNGETGTNGTTRLNSVPEPSSLALAGLGTVLVGLFARRRRAGTTNA